MFQISRGSALSQFLAKTGSRNQGVIVEGRCAEVGISRRETAFQLIAVRGYYTFFIQLATTIFQTPFDEWPQSFCLLLASSSQGIAGGSIGYHGTVASIAGTVPNVDTFGNDGTRNRLPFIVHETGEMEVGIESRSIAIFISYKREERVDIFGLVVCPNGCIVRLATWAMHRAAFRFVDTFASADFGERKHPVDNRVGCFQYQLAHEFIDQGFALVLLFPYIDLRSRFTFLISQESSTECQGFARL